MHDGQIWKPRASTVSLRDGSELDQTGQLRRINPGLWDGDHVLIGFIGGHFSEPVILRGIPHPSADEGKGGQGFPVGERLKLTVADGDPYFIRHHGSFFGMDTDGNYIVSTVGANDGSRDSGNKIGHEKTPDNEGDQTYILPLDATHKIAIVDHGGDLTSAPTEKATVTFTKDGWVLELDGATLHAADKDGDATLTIGDGAVHVAIVEHLQTFYALVKTYLETHTHIDGFGGTGAASVLSGPAPTWDTDINSTKVSLPDG
jgi:hypothetical protein